ncbi:MAG TPA: asparagine synthase (glutamine-hydrolyzing) [Bacteroidia bacterium]|nr:asparagine synthase (glutamine-hydrolyzing) [Bacteroidia bacterium]HNT80376.1 asparagine synthase (glutamine-hydrolyzing) [Bacteroidia bacterium]
MCGIAGFIDTSLPSENERKILLEKMLHSIAHRGPDANGMFFDGAVALGHQRLSIIDLSTEANQPMYFGSLTITYNGEIYNYIEIKESLRDLGYVFKTNSDTEVILASYKRWGVECVKHFVGMWAFAIWDSDQKVFFASRDRFGIKPFYYIQQSGRFYFGSEYKVLNQSPVFNNEVNERQVGRGLQMGWVEYQDETYFSCLKALPAAHNLIIKDGACTINRYWDIETGKYNSLNFKQKKDRFYELFEQSIRQHMRSDVSIASCLSGGIDSSAIASMVQTLYPDQSYKSFSVYYTGEGDVDERPFIDEVLKKYPSIEPHYISPDAHMVEEAFDHALYHADVPCTGSSFISQYFLMQLIRQQNIKVVLDGQGSDEYLAGYMHSFYRLFADMMQAGHLVEPIALTMVLKKKLNLSTMRAVGHFGKSMLSLFRNEQQLYSLEYKNYYPFLLNGNKKIPFHLEKKKGNHLDNFLYHLLFNSSLPSLLHYEDRNSMAFSIESRVPFLDHRLVEFCFELNNRDKIHHTETKYILRESLSNVLPDAIYNRQDKKGFVTPGESKWLRGPLQHLLDINFSTLPFLNAKKCKSIVERYKKGDNSLALLTWRLAVLHYWMNKNV